MRAIALLAASTTVAAVVAFTTPSANHASRSRSFQQVRILRATRAVTQRSMAPAVPNPFKALPWNARKERERRARRLKVESAKLHRELGIADDATFEEISEATGILLRKAESEGDIKKKIKIEVAKDRIMQIRLNERLAGLTSLTVEAKAQSRVEEDDLDDDEDFFPEKKDKEWRVPRWAENIIKKPDAAYRNRQIKVFGALTLICLVLPPIAERIIMINWAFAAGQISRRGMKEPDGDYNPYATRGGKGHQRTAVLLMLGLWLFLKIFTVSTLASVRMTFGPRYAYTVDATIMNIVFGFATAYMQTYKPT